MSKTQAKGGIPMTEEQRKAAIEREIAAKYAMKRASIAEGCLFNLCQNPIIEESDAKQIVTIAVEMADAMMEKLYKGPQE